MDLTVFSLNSIGQIDPSPFFVLSLIPYLIFLKYAKKSVSIPKLSLLGFRLTLLFVFMTIILAIIAKINFDAELTNVDILHGFAESFLTVSDGLVVYGFVLMLQDLRSKKLLRGD